MLIIRLARRGRKKQAFYDIVVAEKARAVQKKYIKKLGYYNPLTEQGKGLIVVDEKLVQQYIKNGAQLSQTAARLLTKHGIKEAGKFIEERASKPKKTEAPKEEKKADKEEVKKEVETAQEEESPAEESAE